MSQTKTDQNHNCNFPNFLNYELWRSKVFFHSLDETVMKMFFLFLSRVRFKVCSYNAVH